MQIAFQGNPKATGTSAASCSSGSPNRFDPARRSVADKAAIARVIEQKVWHDPSGKFKPLIYKTFLCRKPQPPTPDGIERNIGRSGDGVTPRVTPARS